jgi:hypothetical protein
MSIERSLKVAAVVLVLLFFGGLWVAHVLSKRDKTLSMQEGVVLLGIVSVFLSCCGLGSFLMQYDMVVKYNLLGFQKIQVPGEDRFYLPSDWVVSKSGDQKMIVLASREFPTTYDKVIIDDNEDVYFISLEERIDISPDTDLTNPYLVSHPDAYVADGHTQLYSDSIILYGPVYRDNETGETIMLKEIDLDLYTSDQEPDIRFYSVNDSINKGLLALVGESNSYALFS